MNKLTKAAIAGAAGVILLMGGAGSLAYWNDSVPSGPDGLNITAGTLAVTANSGTWTKGFSGNGTYTSFSSVNPSSVAVVPGDRLVYTQTFNVTAAGDDLYFTVSNTPGGITGTGGANAALAGVLNAAGNSTIAVSGPLGGNVTATGVTSGVYKVGAGTGASTITVTWTITFPFGSTADVTTKAGVVSLGQGAVTLTQVANP